jgi:chromosome segregation ATPase
MEAATYLKSKEERMSDELESAPMHDGGSRTMQYVLIAVAIVYVAISGYLIADMYGRVGKLEARATAAETANVELQKEVGKRISGTIAELHSTTGALADKVGLTKKELESRSAALKKQQEETAARLSEESKKGIAQVSGEVSGVKTDVGAVKTDVASTKAELTETKAKLERTIGDLGVQSGLIAKTRDDLEYLKHRGDRNYYEFALSKSRKAPVGTISLELKKVDAKKGKYTMNVYADDKTIEKKDKNMNEPVQFYSGRDRQLYELVVFGIEKDRVTGYLSSPKGAPTPVDVGKKD